MKRKVILGLNALIVVFSVIGLGVMLQRNGGDGGLLSSGGWENLKYFTVLSNIFCGLVALGFLIWIIAARGGQPDREQVGAGNQAEKAGKEKGEYPRAVMAWKLMATVVVAVTFIVVAGFFGPIYGWLPLYRGSNLEFHLIVPVLAMIEFCLLEGELPFRTTLLAGMPALVYGTVYLINILINGKGDWPNTNDWYGFMNWGFAVSIVIFAGIVAVSWGIAVFLRYINGRIQGRRKA